MAMCQRSVAPTTYLHWWFKMHPTVCSIKLPIRIRVVSDTLIPKNTVFRVRSELRNCTDLENCSIVNRSLVTVEAVWDRGSAIFRSNTVTSFMVKFLINLMSTNRRSASGEISCSCWASSLHWLRQSTSTVSETSGSSQVSDIHLDNQQAATQKINQWQDQRFLLRWRYISSQSQLIATWQCPEVIVYVFTAPF